MRILLLEDDLTLAGLIKAYLEEHFIVDHFSDITAVKDHIEHFNYEVLLLDRDINGEDVGMSLIKTIKEKNPNAGVIVISAYGSIQDKIEGLNLGADDYLDKPVDNEELLARIFALARRNTPTQHLIIQDIECDLEAKTLSYQNKTIDLSKKEGDLLFFLLSRTDKISSKEEISNAIYINPQNISSNTIDATIKNIRKKLPINIIKTIKTRGYTIETDTSR